MKPTSQVIRVQANTLLPHLHRYSFSFNRLHKQNADSCLWTRRASITEFYCEPGIEGRELSLAQPLTTQLHHRLGHTSDQIQLMRTQKYSLSLCWKCVVHGLPHGLRDNRLTSIRRAHQQVTLLQPLPGVLCVPSTMDVLGFKRQNTRFASNCAALGASIGRVRGSRMEQTVRFQKSLLAVKRRPLVLRYKRWEREFRRVRIRGCGFGYLADVSASLRRRGQHGGQTGS
mmetsp:Transcript_23944/g.32940  ORF Transcript_23944/g.32940 Transcript_23944/m.32940 type:complete len:229 (-) Transcript_23944:663-1349(-)